jgi:hypothetical protein
VTFLDGLETAAVMLEQRAAEWECGVVDGIRRGDYAGRAKRARELRVMAEKIRETKFAIEMGVAAALVAADDEEADMMSLPELYDDAEDKPN